MNLSLTKIIVFFLILVLVSCLKPEKYPNEPIIEYVSFEQQSDLSSAKLTFSFTDGDGDIGLETEHLYPPYDSGFYYYNVYLNYFEMLDGEWVRGKSNPPYFNYLDNNFSNDTISFAFRLKNITPNGQNKALKGNIELIIEPQFYNPNSNNNDTIMYKAIIIDRSLNHSNLISTPAIIR